MILPNLAIRCATVLLIGCPAFLSAQADITGTVTLKGTPNSQDETFVAPVSSCGGGSIRHTENWKIGPKGQLADVVVWIVDPKFKPLAPPVVEASAVPPPEIQLKQIGCRYDPHVIAVQVGVPFLIINGDPTLHNIRARAYNGPGKPPGATVFNFGQSYQGQKDERQFDDPGIYMLQCDVHNWMQCWVMVLKTRCFAMTEADGRFKLWQGPYDDLLDGDYKIDAWHPRFAAPLEQTVHVKNGSAKVDFTFDATKSF